MISSASKVASTAVIIFLCFCDITSSRISSDTLNLSGIQVFLDHKRYFENNSMVKLSQIQSGNLLDFLQPINKCITMYKKLSRRLRNVQIILEKFVDGV